MNTADPVSPRRVAVVGSGVSGLTAAWVLQRSGAEVTLYEADARLGGHAHTHDIMREGGDSVALDTGFIVHNERTYPNLLRLFDELDVATQPSDMSMSVRCDGCGLEYAGARGPRGLFAHSRRLTDGRYLRMLTEVPRFHRGARALLAEAGDSEITLARFLTDGGYSDYFVSHFAAPLVAAVWSCSPGTAMQYPARYLFAFLANHGMLRVTGSPQWRTVVGGSRNYVERIAKQITRVRPSTPVRCLRRLPDGDADRVEIRDDADQVAGYDAAVVATHPHQALRLLTEPTPTERTVLGAIGYSRNAALLHTDASVLPRSPAAQASWNYRMDGCRDGADQVLVSYDLNRLQSVPTPPRYLVSLNAADDVADRHVIERMDYEHPIYTPASVAAQARLPELDDDRVAFAGAYHGWGFHEDGCSSGLRAAQRLGATW